MSDIIKIYKPDIDVNKSCLFVYREMFIELINNLEIIRQLFKREFIIRYKQTILGILWAVIMPIIMIGAFIMIEKSGIVNIEKTDIPYPLFALWGLTLWQLFARGVVASSSSLINGGSMILNVDFSRETLVIASLSHAICDFIVRCVLLFLCFIIFRVVPAWTIIFLPIALIPICLLTIGLGFIFSLLTAVVRDISYILTLATTFILFLTPVLYPTPKYGIFAKITMINPLAILITEARDIVFIGSLSNPLQYGAASLFSFFIFMVGWRIFHLVEKRIPERI